ncbi:type VI secretion protein VgrG, partial [Chimaeribacter coloradensis]
RITINGGGSYITLDENSIESATAGDYNVRTGYYQRMTKAQQLIETVELPTLEPDSNHRFSSIKSIDGTRSTELIFKPFSGEDAS